MGRLAAGAKPGARFAAMAQPSKARDAATERLD